MTSIKPNRSGSPNLINKRILVVEDEPEIAKAYERLLAPTESASPRLRSSRSSRSSEVPTAENKVLSHYEIVVVHNGEDAIAKVRDSVRDQRPFAMAFVDVLLGAGIDGISVVKELHNIDHDIYCVFVTAYQDRSVDAINDVLGTEMAFRWDYLTKPFSEGEILQKARSGVSIWNLKYENQQKEEELIYLRDNLLQSERSKTVAAMAQSIGHEFGNILVQIIGRAELSLNSDDTEQMKTALQGIIQAGETANNILDRFNKAAPREIEDIEKSPVDLTHVANQSCDLLLPQLQKTSTQVNVSTEGSGKIVGYPNSLIQVFVNLIINATHAMEDSQSKQIDVLVKDQQDSIEVSLRDHGPGIPEELLSRITRAFFTTKGSKGTGLGLAICKEIVEIEHGGSFQVANHPQGGAVFTLRFPVTTEGADNET